MKNKECVVFDIGSSSIITMCATKAPNNTFKILHQIETPYSGYAKQEFKDSHEVKEVIIQNLTALENIIGIKNRDIFVGVPSEFCIIEVSDRVAEFGKKRKIKNEDLEPLFDYDKKYKMNTNQNQVTKDYDNICNSSLYFELDNGQRVENPINSISSSLKARIVYGFCKKEITRLIQDTFKHKRYNAILTLTSIPEANYILSQKQRQNYQILLDVGYMSTSLMTVFGDGLENLFSFSYGSKKIESVLSESLDITILEADKLKNRAVLTLTKDDELFYQYEDVSSGKKFSARLVNEIITDFLEKLGSIIKKCVDTSPVSQNLETLSTIYLTGGGISYISGIKEVLGKILNMEVEIVYPPIPVYNKPHLSSVFGLLKYALDNEN